VTTLIRSLAGTERNNPRRSSKRKVIRL